MYAADDTVSPLKSGLLVYKSIMAVALFNGVNYTSGNGAELVVKLNYYMARTEVMQH